MRRKPVQRACDETEDHLGDGGFADPAKCQPGDGNAELDGGKKLVDGVLEFERSAGAGSAEEIIRKERDGRP